jgi:hypothetical protein
MPFKSLLIASFFFVVTSGMPVSAFADSTPLVPVSALQVGKYTSQGGFVSKVSVEQWAESYVMKGRMTYGGDVLKFDVMLAKDVSTGNPNVFSGSGTMYQGWDTGEVCTYRIRIEVYAYADRLFIRHYAPGQLYTTWSASGGCPPPAAESSWGQNPNPFFLVSPIPPKPTAPPVAFPLPVQPPKPR